MKCGQHILSARGNVLIAPGWKILFGKSLDEDDDAPQALPTLKQGQICQISDSEIKPYKHHHLITSRKVHCSPQ